MPHPARRPSRPWRASPTSGPATAWMSARAAAPSAAAWPTPSPPAGPPAGSVPAPLPQIWAAPCGCNTATRFVPGRDSFCLSHYKKVAHNGSGVGRGTSFNSFKDTLPDPTPAFLPPEHEGRKRDPNALIQRAVGFVPAVSAQAPYDTLALKSPERERQAAAGAKSFENIE